MPYIKKERRYELEDWDVPRSAGELNYELTKKVVEYLGSAPKYKDFNEVLGVLTAMQLELYRRLVAPYEDDKIADNGDVY